MITLQFESRKTPMGAITRWRSWHWATHVDFVLPNGDLLSAYTNGVHIRPDDPIRKNSYHVERYTFDAPESCYDYALSQVGKKYDWWAVLGILIKRDWDNEEKWFCSELIARSCQEAGFPIIRASHMNRVMPAHLLMNPMLVKDTSFTHGE